MFLTPPLNCLYISDNQNECIAIFLSYEIFFCFIRVSNFHTRNDTRNGSHSGDNRTYHRRRR